MKTHSPKVSSITRAWRLFDAKDYVLGRLATHIASLLMAKHKADFTRHLDMSDHIVVINASQIKVTGHKRDQKLYRRHSGYPGGFKELTFRQVAAAHPERILLHAVSGMLPKNKLQAKFLTHLHIYPGPDHPYAQHFKN